jgi:hypothetical protein
MAGMEAQLAALQDELRASIVSRHHLQLELEAVKDRDFRTQVSIALCFIPSLHWPLEQVNGRRATQC